MGIIEELLFPRKCANCGKLASYICSECETRIDPREAICPMCEKMSIDGWVHGRCRRPQGMDRLIAPVRYRGVMQKILKKVKYKSAWDMLLRVVEVFWGRAREDLQELGEEWVVVGVPMYRKKERMRGFNQAEALAVMVARKMGVEQGRLLERIKATRAQYGLSPKERAENVRGVFQVSGEVKGRKVLLIDDVWTTGSTMRECAKVLKRAGAKEAWGVVMGR